MIVLTALQHLPLNLEDRTRTILDRSLQWFMAYGAKSMTMDQISHNQGLSKKTLYQQVGNKQELVYKAFHHFLAQQEASIQAVQDQNLNVIDELYQIYQLTIRNIFYMNPILPYDLQRYYPQTWTLFENHRDQFLNQCVTDNFSKGVDLGLYRSNLEIPIEGHLFLSQLHFLFHQYSKSHLNYPLNTIANEIFQYHLHGIGSDKGVAYAGELGLNTTS